MPAMKVMKKALKKGRMPVMRVMKKTLAKGRKATGLGNVDATEAHLIASMVDQGSHPHVGVLRRQLEW
jgi:hypothetical protein